MATATCQAAVAGAAGGGVAASALPCSASSATTSCVAVGRSRVCCDKHASISATAPSQHSTPTSTPLQSGDNWLLSYMPSCQIALHHQDGWCMSNAGKHSTVHRSCGC